MMEKKRNLFFWSAWSLNPIINQKFSKIWKHAPFQSNTFITTKLLSVLFFKFKINLIRKQMIAKSIFATIEMIYEL